METTFFDLIRYDTCSSIGLAARNGNLSALREMLDIGTLAFFMHVLSWVFSVKVKKDQ